MPQVCRLRRRANAVGAHQRVGILRRDECIQDQLASLLTGVGSERCLAIRAKGARDATLGDRAAARLWVIDRTEEYEYGRIRGAGLDGKNSLTHSRHKL